MSPESDKKSLFFVPSFSCLSKIPDDELHSELETLYSILNCRLSIKSILSEMIFTDEEFKSLSSVRTVSSENAFYTKAEYSFW